MTDVDFKNHYVAFIDILGFSAMVEHDSRVAQDGRLYVDKLYEVHRAIGREVAGIGFQVDLIQFSDSVVLATAVRVGVLFEFCELVAKYQKQLLERHLLCRGGIAYGKHFSARDFVFSDALIQAYRLETSTARYPRIVLSSDVYELQERSERQRLSPILLKEEDGALFVDYLSCADEVEKAGLTLAVTHVCRAAAGTTDVAEKLRWLAAYADFRLQTRLSEERFRLI